MISDILLNKVLLKARSSQYHWQGLVFSIYSSRRMLGEVKSKLRYYYNKGLFLINQPSQKIILEAVLPLYEIPFSKITISW